MEFAFRDRDPSKGVPMLVENAPGFKLTQALIARCSTKTETCTASSLRVSYQSRENEDRRARLEASPG